MRAKGFQIIGIWTVCSVAYSDWQQRKIILHITEPLWRNAPVTRGFPHKGLCSNAESASISWRHHMQGWVIKAYCLSSFPTWLPHVGGYCVINRSIISIWSLWRYQSFTTAVKPFRVQFRWWIILLYLSQIDLQFYINLICWIFFKSFKDVLILYT